MVKVKQLTLDVLKPHYPNVLDFACALCAEGADYKIGITVVEMDDKTETLEVIIEGTDVQFDRLLEKIKELGGSLHSIDEVIVVSGDDDRID